MRALIFPVSALGVILIANQVKADEALDQLAESASQVQQAVAAVKSLNQRTDLTITDVLSKMNGQSAVAKNWYLSVAQSYADRDAEKATQELGQFLTRLSEDSTARYWAFTYLTREDSHLREEMLESMLADPCLELRFEAVALRMRRLEEADMPAATKLAAYQELLAAARLPEQVQSVASKLKELGEEVDLLRHFGFVASWDAIGVFNNESQTGFDVVYAPEQEYASGKLSSENLPSRAYLGKVGDANWQAVNTDKPNGAVDLNEAYDNAKGAIVYALGNFESDQERNCEVRIGSPVAVKVWVNGELVISREVYHAGDQIDQYTAPVRLRKGGNTILVKSCQNEQTEDWAQDWSFQLRFTDSTGLAIQAAK